MFLDVLLVSLALAAGLTLTGIGLQRPVSWVGSILIFAVSIAGAITVSTAWRYTAGQSAFSNQVAENRPIESNDSGYISSDKCLACHPHHHDTWHSSHHRTMTQVPTGDSVIADFDNKVLRHSGQEFRFYENDGEFFMDITGSGLPTKRRKLSAGTYKIVLSTGAHHQQSFWCETDDGRTLQKIPFIWITSENRWIPYGSIFFIPSSGLSMHAGVWNRNCIKCHVVGGQPRTDTEIGYDTQVAEFGIACEACHGPAEHHAAAHRNPLNRYAQHFSSDDDPTLINPADLTHEKSSQTCGQCHAIFDFYDNESKQNFDRNGFDYRPGDDLRDSRHIFQFGQNEDLPALKRKLKTNPKFFERQFWSDGMVRVSGREYNGLLETPCYQRGTMSCLSCHEMHPHATDPRPREEWADDQLRPSMRGNESCIQCHEEFQSEDSLVSHTHHSADSSGSQCYNCHMPHTTLGLMKAMRSHTVDSPSVSTTLETGRPNACNLCHLDKTLAWTSQQLGEWVPAFFSISRSGKNRNRILGPLAAARRCWTASNCRLAFRMGTSSRGIRNKLDGSVSSRTAD